MIIYSSPIITITSCELSSYHDNNVGLHTNKTSSCQRKHMSLENNMAKKSIKKKKKTHGEKDCWKVQTPNITLTHLFIIYYYMKFDKILSLI